MTTLIMLWCLAGSCEAVQDTVTFPSPMACAMFGQLRASDWQREHPAYSRHQLRMWRCEAGQSA